jgi:HK97 family phage prohead protease
MSDLSARLAMTGTQYRSVTLDDWELRANDGDTEWSFEGIACTVDHPYPVRDWLGEYTETIAAGAFDRSLADTAAPISLHMNHQHGKAAPLAVRSATASTLQLSADPHLRLSAQLDPARIEAQTLRSVLRRGEMTEMSIGFRDVSTGVHWSDDYTKRTLTDLRLREASVVEDGCNDLTSASIRSLTNELQRFKGSDVDEVDIRRAIAWLEGLLPDDEVEVLETFERTGLVVTDELIRLYEGRHGF